MHEQPRASVIIPTYNRATYLARCLEALAAQTTEPATFEILVVDNGPGEDTRITVIEAGQRHTHMRLHYLHEPRQGLGFARNCGVAAARGAVVCFLDDDTIAPPHWLEALLAAFCDPTVGCAGGPALPDYQGYARPPWLNGDLQGLLSGYKLPYTVPTPITAIAEFPFGCNLAVRRALFRAIGHFRTDLDRIGTQSLAAGDTELIGRVQRAGWRILYCPGAPVRHLMAPERLERRYLYRIGRGLAASHVLLTADQHPLVVLRWFASDGLYAARMLGALCAALIARKPLWFDDYMRFWIIALRLPLRVRLLVRGSVA